MYELITFIKNLNASKRIVVFSISLIFFLFLLLIPFLYRSGSLEGSNIVKYRTHIKKHIELEMELYKVIGVYLDKYVTPSIDTMNKLRFVVERSSKNRFVDNYKKELISLYIQVKKSQELYKKLDAQKYILISSFKKYQKSLDTYIKKLENNNLEDNKKLTELLACLNKEDIFKKNIGLKVQQEEYKSSIIYLRQRLKVRKEVIIKYKHHTKKIEQLYRDIEFLFSRIKSQLMIINQIDITLTIYIDENHIYQNDKYLDDTIKKTSEVLKDFDSISKTINTVTSKFKRINKL